MKYDEFRNFRITRTCNKEYKPYKSYKKFLKKDFHNRCAYCNTWDFIIEPLGFAIPKTLTNTRRINRIH